MKRKDMGDLKKDVAHTARTSKEIVQDAFNDVKKRAQDAGQDVKQTAVNVSRNATASEPPHQTEKTN